MALLRLHSGFLSLTAHRRMLHRCSVRRRHHPQTNRLPHYCPLHHSAFLTESPLKTRVATRPAIQPTLTASPTA